MLSRMRGLFALIWSRITRWATQAGAGRSAPTARLSEGVELPTTQERSPLGGTPPEQKAVAPPPAPGLARTPPARQVGSPYRLPDPVWNAALHQPVLLRSSQPYGATEPALEGFQQPPEEVIDLHTFHPRDIPSVVEEFIWAARQHDLEQLRIIHGKGKGVQKQRVQKILASHPDVVYFSDAPPEAGGWGATVVKLKRTR